MGEGSPLVEEILKTFKRASCKADTILYPRQGRSIDIAANAGDRSILIKVVEDASALSRSELSDLRKAKRAYQSPVIVVAVENQKKRLEDDVVYVRHGTAVVTPKTLENYLIKGDKPIVACIRGGYVLKVNPGKLRERRERLGCSRGLIAETLGTSKKAVYMYERGEMYISVEKGIKLASILGEDIFEEFDFIREEYDEAFIEEKNIPRDSIEEAIYRLTLELGTIFMNFARLPVDVVIKGKLTISVVKEDSTSELPEKIESAEKLASIAHTTMILVRSAKDIVHLRRALSRGTDGFH